LAAVLALPVCTFASDWKLEAGVTGRETYTDNVALTSTNRQSDFITEVNPFINASKKGARFQADVHYTLQNLFYADQSSRNRTNHQLAAGAKAELYENELFLDANASISQQLTSLLGAVGTDNTSATGNLATVYSVSVSPYWQHRFGSTANLLARYSHSEVSSSGSSFSNSSINAVNASLSSGSAFKDVFWSLAASDQETDYSNRPNVTISTVSGTLGYSITPKLRVNGTVGYDKNQYQSAGAPIEGSFWTAGASWAPSNRTSLSGSFGERYFGKTYSFAFDHRARTTTWHAAYAQNVTTTSSQFSLPYGVSTADYLDSQLLSLYPDPAERAFMVALITAVYGLPPVLTDRLNLLTNAVYLDKRFDASVAYKTAKTVTTLTLFDAMRESLESGSSSTILFGGDIFASTQTVKQRGGAVSWLWRMNPRLSASASFNLSRNSFPTLGRTDTLTAVNLGLTRTFNNKLTGGVSVRHQQRSSNTAGSDFKENAVIGSVSYKF